MNLKVCDECVRRYVSSKTATILICTPIGIFCILTCAHQEYIGGVLQGAVACAYYGGAKWARVLVRWTIRFLIMFGPAIVINPLMIADIHHAQAAAGKSLTTTPEFVIYLVVYEVVFLIGLYLTRIVDESTVGSAEAPAQGGDEGINGKVNSSINARRPIVYGLIAADFIAALLFVAFTYATAESVQPDFENFFVLLLTGLEASFLAFVVFALPLFIVFDRLPVMSLGRAVVAAALIGAVMAVIAGWPDNVVLELLKFNLGDHAVQRIWVFGAIGCVSALGFWPVRKASLGSQNSQ